MTDFGAWAAILVLCVASLHQSEGTSVSRIGLKTTTSGQNELNGSATNNGEDHGTTLGAETSISETSFHNVTTEHSNSKQEEVKTVVTIENSHDLPDHELTFDKSHNETSHTKKETRYEEETAQNSSLQQSLPHILNAPYYNALSSGVEEQSVEKSTNESSHYFSKSVLQNSSHEFSQSTGALNVKANGDGQLALNNILKNGNIGFDGTVANNLQSNIEANVSGAVGTNLPSDSLQQKVSTSLSGEIEMNTSNTLKQDTVTTISGETAVASSFNTPSPNDWKQNLGSSVSGESAVSIGISNGLQHEKESTILEGVVANAGTSAQNNIQSNITSSIPEHAGTSNNIQKNAATFVSEGVRVNSTASDNIRPNLGSAISSGLEKSIGSTISGGIGFNAGTLTQSKIMTNVTSGVSEYAEVSNVNPQNIGLVSGGIGVSTTSNIMQPNLVTNTLQHNIGATSGATASNYTQPNIATTFSGTNNAQHTAGTSITVNGGVLSSLKQNNIPWISEGSNDYAMPQKNIQIGQSSSSIETSIGNMGDQYDDHLSKPSLEPLIKSVQLMKVIEVVSNATSDDNLPVINQEPTPVHDRTQESLLKTQESIKLNSVLANNIQQKPSTITSNAEVHNSLLVSSTAYTNQDANKSIKNGDFTPSVQAETNLSTGPTDATSSLPVSTRTPLENLTRIAQLMKIIEVVSNATTDDGISMVNGQTSNNSQKLSTSSPVMSSSHGSSLAVGGSVKLNGAAEYNRPFIGTTSSTQGNDNWQESKFENGTEWSLKPSNGGGVNIAASETNKFIPLGKTVSGGNLNIVGSPEQYSDFSHRQNQSTFANQNFANNLMKESTTSTHYNKYLTTIQEESINNKSEVLKDRYNTVIPIAQQGISLNGGFGSNQRLSVLSAQGGDKGSNQQENILTTNTQSTTTSYVPISQASPTAEGAINLYAAYGENKEKPSQSLLEEATKSNQRPKNPPVSSASYSHVTPNVHTTHYAVNPATSTSTATNNYLAPEIPGTVKLHGVVGSNQEHSTQPAQESVTASSQQQNFSSVQTESHTSTTSNMQTPTLITPTVPANSFSNAIQGSVNIHTDIGSNQKHPTPGVQGSVAGSSQQPSLPSVTSGNHANSTSSAKIQHNTETLGTTATNNKFIPAIQGFVNLQGAVGGKQEHPTPGVQGSVAGSSQQQRLPSVTSGSRANASSSAKTSHNTETPTVGTPTTTNNKFIPAIQGFINLQGAVGGKQEHPTPGVQGSVAGGSSQQQSLPSVTSGGHANASSSAKTSHNTETPTVGTPTTTNNKFIPAIQGFVNLQGAVGGKQEHPTPGVQGSVAGSSQQQRLPSVTSGSRANASSSANTSHNTETPTVGTSTITNNKFIPAIQGFVNLQGAVGGKPEHPTPGVQGSVAGGSSQQQSLPSVTSGSRANASSSAKTSHNTETPTVGTSTITNNKFIPAIQGFVNLQGAVGGNLEHPTTGVPGSVAGSSQQQSLPSVTSGSRANASSSAKTSHNTETPTVGTPTTTNNKFIPAIQGFVNLQGAVGGNLEHPTPGVPGSVAGSSQQQSLPSVTSGSRANASSSAKTSHNTETPTVGTPTTTNNKFIPAIQGFVNLQGAVGGNLEHPTPGVPGSVAGSSQQQSLPSVTSGSHANASSSAKTSHNTETPTVGTSTITNNKFIPAIQGFVNLQGAVGGNLEHPTPGVPGSVAGLSQQQSLPSVTSGSRANASSSAKTSHNTETPTVGTPTTTNNKFIPAIQGFVNLQGAVGGKQEHPTPGVPGSVAGGSSQQQSLPSVTSGSRANASSSAKTSHNTETPTVGTSTITNNKFSPAIQGFVNLQGAVGGNLEHPTPGVPGSVAGSSQQQSLPSVTSGSHANASSSAKTSHNTETPTVGTSTITNNKFIPAIQGFVNLQGAVGGNLEHPTPGVPGSVAGSSQQQSLPSVTSGSRANASSSAKTSHNTETPTVGTPTTTNNKFIPAIQGFVNLQGAVGGKQEHPTPGVPGSVAGGSSQQQSLPSVTSGSRANASSSAKTSHNTETPTVGTSTITNNKFSPAIQGFVNLQGAVGGNLEHPTPGVPGSVAGSSQQQSLPSVTSGSHANASSSAKTSHNTETPTVGTSTITNNKFIPAIQGFVNLQGAVGGKQEHPTPGVPGSVAGGSSQQQTLPSVTSGSRANASSSAKTSHNTETPTVGTSTITNNKFIPAIQGFVNLQGAVGGNLEHPTPGVPGSVAGSSQQQSLPSVTSGSRANASSSAKTSHNTETPTVGTSTITNNKFIPAIQGFVNLQGAVGGKQEHPAPGVHGFVAGSSQLPSVTPGSHANASSNANVPATSFRPTSQGAIGVDMQLQNPSTSEPYSMWNVASGESTSSSHYVTNVTKSGETSHSYTSEINRDIIPSLPLSDDTSLLVASSIDIHDQQRSPFFNYGLGHGASNLVNSQQQSQPFATLDVGGTGTLVNNDQQHSASALTTDGNLDVPNKVDYHSANSSKMLEESIYTQTSKANTNNNSSIQRVIPLITVNGTNKYGDQESTLLTSQHSKQPTLTFGVNGATGYTNIMQQPSTSANSGTVTEESFHNSTSEITSHQQSQSAISSTDLSVERSTVVSSSKKENDSAVSEKSTRTLEGTSDSTATAHPVEKATSLNPLNISNYVQYIRPNCCPEELFFPKSLSTSSTINEVVLEDSNGGVTNTETQRTSANAGTSSDSADKGQISGGLSIAGSVDADNQQTSGNLAVGG